MNKVANYMTVTIRNRYDIEIPEEFRDAVLFSGLTSESSLSERLFRLYKTGYCISNGVYANTVDEETVLLNLAEDLRISGDYSVVRKMYDVAEAEAFRDGII